MYLPLSTLYLYHQSPRTSVGKVSLHWIECKGVDSEIAIFFLTTESWRAHNSTRDWSRMVEDGVCMCGCVWVCAWRGVGQEGKALSSGPCGNWLNFLHWWTWKWPISITGVSMNSLPWTGPGLTQCPELRVIRGIRKAGPGIASESAFCQLLCEDLGTWK